MRPPQLSCQISDQMDPVVERHGRRDNVKNTDTPIRYNDRRIFQPLTIRLWKKIESFNNEYSLGPARSWIAEGVVKNSDNRRNPYLRRSCPRPARRTVLSSLAEKEAGERRRKKSQPILEEKTESTRIVGLSGKADRNYRGMFFA